MPSSPRAPLGGAGDQPARRVPGPPRDHRAAAPRTGPVPATALQEAALGLTGESGQVRPSAFTTHYAECFAELGGAAAPTRIRCSPPCWRPISCAISGCGRNPTASTRLGPGRRLFCLRESQDAAHCQPGAFAKKSTGNTRDDESPHRGGEALSHRAAAARHLPDGTRQGPGRTTGCRQDPHGTRLPRLPPPPAGSGQPANPRQRRFSCRPRAAGRTAASRPRAAARRPPAAWPRAWVSPRPLSCSGQTVATRWSRPVSILFSWASGGRLSQVPVRGWARHCSCGWRDPSARPPGTGSTSRPARAGSGRTIRCGGSTPTRPCASAGSAPCSGSPCTLWRWPPSPGLLRRHQRCHPRAGRRSLRCEGAPGGQTVPGPRIIEARPVR